MIDRIIKYRILESLKLKEITVLTGARQVGKTTILKEIIETLDNAIYFNLDIEQDSIHFHSQEIFLNKIKLEVGNENAYVFIDEIQQKEDAGRFMKGLYDMDLPYKFIITGSGSIELKEKISEALTGRKYLLEMSTVNFEEFVNYKTNNKYKERLETFFEVELEKTKLFLDEYLKYGGYPAIVTAETILRKKEIMNEIFVSYLTKDISFLLGVKYPDKFVKMIQLLAVQSGSILNYSQLSQDVGIRLETLKTYLWYAEQTFIITIVKPFFSNAKKEITKSPNIYFNDLGMCNFSKSSFNADSNDGFVFQNFVYTILKEKYEKGLSKINYWRTKDKAEVDFVVHTENGITPIEVKFSELKNPRVTRSFRSFIKKYSPKMAYVVNLSLDSSIIIEESEVVFIPYWKLKI
ncbi:MAG: ATP-binding protein [Flavobacteriales bacterium]|nr:ATP-binding protein [Flavobacteriales bacterium]